MIYVLSFEIESEIVTETITRLVNMQLHTSILQNVRLKLHSTNKFAVK